MKSTRRFVQFAFLLFVLAGVFLVGADAERWCPFGGVEAIYTYIDEGSMTCSLGVSNFFILGGILLMVLLLRRAFCGYACPIGAISELLQDSARRIGIKPWQVPAGADRILSLLKYPVLGVILYITWKAGELLFRGFDPCYALISRHGEDITFWSYAVLVAIALGSLFVTVPFCRWLCPLAAVLNPLSRFGLVSVRRDQETCVDCGLCSKACPMAIPVARRDRVKEARCTACMDCVKVCPERDRGALSMRALWTGRAAAGRGRPRFSQAALIAIMLACLASSVGAALLFPLPSYVMARGTPPGQTAILEIEVENLACRGNATLFVYFLERDDELEIPGYLKVEAWPGAGTAPVHITYDPGAVDEEMIKMAIVEPYFDSVASFWRVPPFKIVGYDPLGLD